MLEKSRFSRRLHRIKSVLLTLFNVLGETWKETNDELIYSIDTFPVSVCDNYRIRRSKLYRGEAYCGYIASKKRFYYGIKVHLLVTKDGEPVEFFLTPGADSDVGCLDPFDFDLTPESTIYADRIYKDYELQEVMEIAGLHFQPMRKKNSKRPFPPYIQFCSTTIASGLKPQLAFWNNPFTGPFMPRRHKDLNSRLFFSCSLTAFNSLQGSNLS
jgi:hypothetical protein